MAQIMIASYSGLHEECEVNISLNSANYFVRLMKLSMTDKKNPASGCRVMSPHPQHITHHVFIPIDFFISTCLADWI